MTTVPSSSLTVTDWYKQDVYDQSNTKIGQIMDVLVGQDGQVSALIVSVGGFLGAGEKDVAVSFNTVKALRVMSLSPTLAGWDRTLERL